jgi:hypothetical protein
MNPKSNNEVIWGMKFRFVLLSFFLQYVLFVPQFGFFLTSASAEEYSRGGDAAQASLGPKVYLEALWIFNHAITVHYQHVHESVSEQVQMQMANDTCESVNDCSGFVSYVVAAVAPKHYEVAEEFMGRRSHPRADDYAKFFDSLSTDRPTHGWLKITSPGDLMRGDIIAWENPSVEEGLKHTNTGHVMIVVSPPEGVKRANIGGSSISFIPVYVIDSSSVDHFPPESLPPLAHQSHRDGVGMGVIRLVVDEQGNPIGYWEGTFWGEGNKAITKPRYADMIRMARLLPHTRD